MGTRGLLLVSVIYGLFVNSLVFADTRKDEEVQSTNTLSPTYQALAIQGHQTFVANSHSAIENETKIPARVFSMGREVILKFRDVQKEFGGLTDPLIRAIDKRDVNFKFDDGEVKLVRIDGVICFLVFLKNEPKKVYFAYDFKQIAESSKELRRIIAEETTVNRNDFYSMEHDSEDLFNDPNVKISPKIRSQMSWASWGRNKALAYLRMTPVKDSIFAGSVGLLEVGGTIATHVMVGMTFGHEVGWDRILEVAYYNAAYTGFFSLIQASWGRLLKLNPDHRFYISLANSLFFRALLYVATGGSNSDSLFSAESGIGIASLLMGTWVAREVKNEVLGTYFTRLDLGDFDSKDTEVKKIRILGNDLMTVDRYPYEEARSRLILAIPSQASIALAASGHPVMASLGVLFYGIYGIIYHYKSLFGISHRAEQTFEKAQEVKKTYGEQHGEYVRLMTTYDKEKKQMERLELQRQKTLIFKFLPIYGLGKAWFKDYLFDKKVKPIFRSLCEVVGIRTRLPSAGDGQVQN